MLIGTVPGEPTTTTGGRIRAAMAEAAQSAGIEPDSVVLLGLTNGYDYYVATPEEYGRQHYEGSSTLFGPQTSVVLQQALAQLAASIPRAGAPSPPSPVPPVVVFPGKQKKVMPLGDAHDVPRQRSMDTEWHGDTLVARWNDSPPGTFVPADGPVLSIQHEGNGSWRTETWDDDLELEVRWMAGRGNIWEARWTPCVRVGGRYRVVLFARRDLPEVIHDVPGAISARVCRPSRGSEHSD
jgi:neutral ceramidase